MTAYSSILMFVTIAAAVFAVGLRTTQWTRLKAGAQSSRYAIFIGIWPICFTLIHEFNDPFMAPLLFDAARTAVITAAIMDSVHYFGIRHARRVGTAGALTFASLCWVFALRWWWLPSQASTWTMPMHGYGIVQVEGVWRVHTIRWTPLPGWRFNDLEVLANWSQGRAVFSPFDCVVEEVGPNSISLRSALGESIRLSPLMTETIRVQMGMVVFGGQPLGLLEGSSPPGLKVEVSGGALGVPRFEHGGAGRIWAREIHNTRVYDGEYAHSRTGTSFTQ